MHALEALLLSLFVTARVDSGLSSGDCGSSLIVFVVGAPLPRAHF